MSEKYRDASCRQMPVEAVDEFFFEAQITNARSKIELAKRICQSCVVLQPCREAALTEMPSYGVMAAMTPMDRDRVKYGGDAA